MINKIKYVFISALMIGSFSLVPVTAFAEDGVTTNATTSATDEAKCDFKLSILPCMTIPEMLDFVVAMLSALVGVAAVASIVFAGILYTTAGGDTEKTKKAITWIRNTVIGIIAYAAMYLLLNFIIPGGAI